jgi:hypothetical protein
MSHDQDKKCLDDSIMVDTSNAPWLGSDVVVVTARIMSVAQTQAKQWCGSVLYTLYASVSYPPMFIRRSATGLRHRRRLFGETLRVAGTMM